jgi:hypothetical protein
MEKSFPSFDLWSSSFRLKNGIGDRPRFPFSVIIENLMRNKILVIGGAGYIGSHMVKALVGLIR